MAEVLSVAASVAGLLTLAESVFSSTFAFCKDVKHAQRDISRLSTQISALSGTLYRLSLLTRRLEVQGSDCGIKHDNIYECQVLLESVKKKLSSEIPCESDKKKSAKKVLQSISWPFNKSHTENLLSQIERVKSTFDLALSAENMSALANLTEDVRCMKNELLHRRELDVKIKLDKKRRKVIDFFGRVDPRENHQMGLKLRQSGTGLWLTKGDSFQAWLRSPDGNLWLYGIPGAGKTVLASAVIQDTIETLKSGESVAYFYCDYKDESRQDPQNIFGSIAAQLALQDEGAFEMLNEFYDLIQKEGSLVRSASPEQIVDLIKKQTSRFHINSLILDGLDECGDNVEEVLDLWISLKKEAFGAIKTIVLSRELEVIQKRLIEEDYSGVSIAAQSTDIRLYVAAEIKQRGRKGRWDIDDPALNDFIQQKLVEKAQGMFRWVACQLDYLWELPDEEECRRALDTLPPTLNGTYERILERVSRKPESTQRLVEQSLRWILFARKPLTVNQLCQAVAVGVADEKLGRPVKEVQILRHCSCLVRKSNNGLYIESAHFTVKEFMQAITPSSHPHLAQFSITKEVAFLELGKTCLRYLNMGDFCRRVPETWKEMQEFLEKFDFYYHCGTEWAYYLAQSQAETEVKLLLRKLFDPRQSSNFLHWWRCVVWQWASDSAPDWPELYETCVGIIEGSGYSALHWASLFALPDIVFWLAADKNITDMNGFCGTPLHAAIIGPGKECLAQWQHANSDRDYDMLSIQIEGNWDKPRLECVRTLLSLDADWTIPFSLPGACKISIAELLLHTMDIDVVNLAPFSTKFLDKDVLNRLHSGQKGLSMTNMVSILQRIGTETIKSDCRTDFLEFVVALKALNTLTKLNEFLEDDSNPNLLLHSAAKHGQVDLLRDILKLSGFTVDFADDMGMTALHFAALSGSPSCVTALLDKGFSPLVKDNNNWTTLHFATQGPDNDSTILILLGLGGNPLEPDTKGDSPLHTAARMDNVKQLETFTTNCNLGKEELNQRNSEGFSPLLTAANHGSEKALTYLLPYGTVCDKSNSGASLLLLAAQKCSGKTIRSLIEAGADPLSKDSDGSTILHYLVHNDHDVMPIITELLSSDMTVAANVHGNLPLHSLFWSTIDITHKPRLAEALLLAGADPAKKNNDQESFFSLLLDDIHRASFTLPLPPPPLGQLPSPPPPLSPKYLNEANIASSPRVQLLRASIPWIKELDTLTEPVGGRRPLNIMLGYPNLALELLDRGVDPTLRDKIGNEESALELACMGDNAELLDALLKKCVNPTKPNKHGNSLLHIACRVNKPNKNIVKRILSLGINANTRGQYGDLALISVVQSRNTEIAIILLDSGARPDHQGGGTSGMQWHTTAMHAAVNTANLTVLTRIAEESPNWDVRVHNVIFPGIVIPRLEGRMFSNIHCLLFAVVYSPIDILRFLLQQCLNDINCRTSQGQTPIHIAAMVGNIEAAQALIDEGAEVGLQDSHGNTPLHYAVETGDRELVLGLLQAGSPQIANKMGITPELSAFIDQRPEIAGILREWSTMHEKSDRPPVVLSKPTQNQRLAVNGAFSAPLSNALRAGDLNEFKRIASALESNIEQRYDECGQCSILQMAIWLCKPSIANWLIDSGCSTNDVSNCDIHGRGFSAIHFVMQNEQCSKDLLEPLFNHSDCDTWKSSPFSPLHVALAAYNIQGLQKFLDLFCNLDNAIQSGRNRQILRCSKSSDLPWLLRHAATVNSLKPVSVSHQLRVLNSVVQFQWTALHLAAKLNNRAAAEILVRHGADINAVDVRLGTPLFLAANWGSIETMNYLLEHGANANDCDSFGRSCLHRASQHKHRGGKAVGLLIEYGADVSAIDIRGINSLGHAKTPKAVASLIAAGCSVNSPELYTFKPANRLLSKDPWMVTLVLNSGYPVTPWVFENPYGFPVSIIKWVWKVCSRRGVTRGSGKGFIGFLSQAAVAGATSFLEERLDASINEGLEEDPHGKPLQLSCKYGRLECVRILILRGSKSQLVDSDIIADAFQHAKHQKAIQAWLLVGRFTEQPKIEWQEMADVQYSMVSRWSGPRQFEIPLRGWYAQGVRSSLEHLIFMAKVDRQRLMDFSESFGTML